MFIIRYEGRIIYRPFVDIFMGETVASGPPKIRQPAGSKRERD